MLIAIQRMGVRAEPKAGVASGAEARGFGPVGYCLEKCTRNANTLNSTCITRGALARRSTMILPWYIYCHNGIGIVVPRR